MSELIKAILSDRARFISPVFYTAESTLITSATALARPFSVSTQINQDTFFLLQKVGVAISEDDAITHIIRTKGPNRSFGKILLKDPVNNRQYFSISNPNINWPGLLNNTADLTDYILIPGNQYISVEFTVTDTDVNNAHYGAFFSGIEYIMRQDADMSAIQELASAYMPPDYIPEPIITRREATPTITDVPAIDRAIAMLQGRFDLVMKEQAQASCNFQIAQCNWGFTDQRTQYWSKIVQIKASEIRDINTTIGTLRARKQSAQATN